jgi:hypothetical protein
MKKSSKGKNRRPGFTGNINEVPTAVRFRGSCARVKSWRAGEEPESHQDSAHQKIGDSSDKSLVFEVAISDFPRRSEPLIIARIRGARSQGFGVRCFGVLVYNEITAGETAIS